MNISLTLKTQKLRSFNLSSNDGFFKNIVKAATLEQNYILLLTNNQVGNKANMLTKEFNLEGYELLNNSTHNNIHDTILRILSELLLVSHTVELVRSGSRSQTIW